MKKLILPILLLSAPMVACADDAPKHWQVLPDKSSVEWQASYGDKPVTGSFPAFTADIAFDPAHLDKSSAKLQFDTGKVKTADHDAQENLPTNDWFAASKFPLATFEVTGFKTGACAPATICNDAFGYFMAEGTLTVRDKTVPVTLPFSAKFYDDKDASPPVHYARIQGETSVKRTALGVGQGDWTATDTIADDVKVTVRLEAKQVP